MRKEASKERRKDRRKEARKRILLTAQRKVRMAAPLRMRCHTRTE